MKNKRGWLRILEAVLAITLLTTVVIYLYARQATTDNSDYFYSVEDKVLSAISENSQVRATVFEENETKLTDFAKPMIPPQINSTIKICNMTQTCSLDTYVNGQVFVSERIFSSNLTFYSPKKVKIFIWEK